MGGRPIDKRPIARRGIIGEGSDVRKWKELDVRGKFDKRLACGTKKSLNNSSLMAFAGVLPISVEAWFGTLTLIALLPNICKRIALN